MSVSVFALIHVCAHIRHSLTIIPIFTWQQPIEGEPDTEKVCTRPDTPHHILSLIRPPLTVSDQVDELQRKLAESNSARDTLSRDKDTAIEERYFFICVCQ